jgi:hypothetical protein
MRGANAQNGTIHRRMRNTPTRRRNGDGPADFVSPVADDPSRIWIPHTIHMTLGSYSRAPRWWSPMLPSSPAEGDAARVMERPRLSTCGLGALRGVVTVAEHVQLPV